MKKLKSDNSITGLIPAIFSLLVLALTSILFSIEVGLDVLGTIMLIYSLIFGLLPFIRTRNSYFLVTLFYMITLGLFMIVFDPGMLRSRGGRLDQTAGFLIVLIYFFMLWLAFLFINKRLKWRGREVMELAAIDVEEGEDSYTDRPRPVGIIQGTRSDITGFAEYLRKKLIFMSSEEADRVVLVPVKMGNEYNVMLKPNIDTESLTRITIDFDGNVSVHISKKDYLDYRDDLSFHHLCESLGNLVIGFYEQYVNREEVRIIDKVNSIKVGYFS